MFPFSGTMGTKFNHQAMDKISNEGWNPGTVGRLTRDFLCVQYTVPLSQCPSVYLMTRLSHYVKTVPVYPPCPQASHTAVAHPCIPGVMLVYGGTGAPFGLTTSNTGKPGPGPDQWRDQAPNFRDSSEFRVVPVHNCHWFRKVAITCEPKMQLKIIVLLSSLQFNF